MRVNQPVTNREIDYPETELLVSRTDSRGIITFVNKAFIEVSGYSEEELLGAPHNLIRHPDMPPAAFADLWATIKAGRPWEGLVKNRARNGDHYWVRANVTPVVEDGGISGYISIRFKPSRAQIDGAERVYARIRAGSAGNVKVEDGQVVPTGLGHRLNKLGTSVAGRLAALSAAMILTIAAVGWFGVSGAGVPVVAGVAAFGGLAVLAGCLMVHRAVRGPLARFEGHFDAITASNFTHEIEAEAAREFHRLTILLRAMKAKLAYAHQERKEQERKATADRCRALQDMAEKVEREAGVAVEHVAASSHAMARNAEDMAELAGRVSGNSQGVAAAAEEALANAQAVAVAAEQLAASIREITTQTNYAGTVSAQAVADGETAQGSIRSLADEVGRIGEIAGLIDTIAAQTNLLALNATIEAARAGEAGRGFAVVAGEVRELATRTARATKEISQVIAKIMSLTEGAVGAVSGIGGTIRRIDGIATSIAAAMEQQTAATHEISRNVTETTVAAREVARLIADVSTDASKAGDEAADVMTASTDVANNIQELREVLVRLVRTSTAETNRRLLERIAVSVPCTVSAHGAEHAGTIADITDAGACVIGGPALAVGETGTLSVAGRILGFEVRSVAAGRLHILFQGAAEARRGLTRQLTGGAAG